MFQVLGLLIVFLMLVIGCGQTPAPTPQAESVPTPTEVPVREPVVVSTEHCAFTLTPPPLSEQTLLSHDRSEGCHYQWLDSLYGNYAVWVSLHKVVTAKGTLAKMQESGKIKGEQHGHTYYGSREVVEGNDSDCDTMEVMRVFAVPNQPGEIMAIRSSICESDWERGNFQKVLLDTLDSFRPM